MMATARDQQIVTYAADAYGANPNELFYLGADESGFRNVANAQGSGARGWFQFKPATFAAFSAQARAANPAAWAGVPQDINNETAQALTTSWAIANGHTGDWSTYPRAATQARTAPVFATQLANGAINAVNTVGNGILGIAHSLLGVQYTWGGTTPAGGFDCSGFVQYVFAKAGYALPRTSQQQASVVTPVSAAQARPGDLVFFDVPGEGANSHVGIYQGNGLMEDAAHTGTSVRVEPVWAGAKYGHVPGVAMQDVGFFGDAAGAVGGAIGDAAGAVKGALGDAGSAAKGVLEAPLDPVAGAITSATNWIGQQIVVVAVGGMSIIIGGALIVYGAITLMGGDAKKTFGDATKAAAVAA